jgi:hypothetical protein
MRRPLQVLARSVSKLIIPVAAMFAVSCDGETRPKQPQTFDVSMSLTTHYYGTGNYDVSAHAAGEQLTGVLVVTGTRDDDLVASLQIRSCSVCSPTTLITRPALGFPGHRSGTSLNLDMTNEFGLPWVRLDGQVNGSTFSGSGGWYTLNGPNGNYYTGNFIATLRP